VTISRDIAGRKKRSILRAPGKHFMQRWPSPKATKKRRDRVRELTDARQSGKHMKRRWQFRRGGQRATHQKAWTGDQLYGMDLHRLQGAVCYPTQATSIRSSLSCARENRTHSLKGGDMETGQR